MFGTAVLEVFIQSKLLPLGMTVRGAFHPSASKDGVPALADGRETQTLVLIGHVGGAMWPAFDAGRTPGPDPLDRWVRAVLTPIAEALDADLVMPSDGPPYLPFQQWAMRVEPVHPSPLGPLIHPEYGFWHGYRGAFLVPETLDLPPPPEPQVSPCESCIDRPCLNTCPVAAFKVRDGSEVAEYDVPACRAHLRGPEGQACLSEACLARAACPIGAEYRYPEAQARFHTTAFRDSGR